MFSFITGMMIKSGALGVFLLMMLENPIPIIPSELILPLAGFDAAKGQLNPVSAILAATFGSVLGGFGWYAVGRALGFSGFGSLAERHGRWLPMTRAEIDRAEHWFTRWGALAVLIGRAVPGVGGVICIPAGMARMGTALFLLASGPGALFWSALLVASGYVLQANFSSVDRWLNPISAGFAAVVAAIYLWRVVRYRPRAPT